MIYAQKFETMDSFFKFITTAQNKEITSGEKLLELIKSELKGSAKHD